MGEIYKNCQENFKKIEKSPNNGGKFKQIGINRKINQKLRKKYIVKPWRKIDKKWKIFLQEKWYCISGGFQFSVAPTLGLDKSATVWDRPSVQKTNNKIGNNVRNYWWLNFHYEMPFLYFLLLRSMSFFYDSDLHSRSGLHNFPCLRFFIFKWIQKKNKFSGLVWQRINTAKTMAPE